MIVLEIIMLIIGIGAVALSFKASDNDAANMGAPTDAIDAKKLKDILNEAKDAFKKYDADMRAKADDIINETDASLGTISNEKIMGLSEYSDQILEKMETNHSETVFLYDMLNEKEKEIKDLVHDADVIKAELRDELAKEYQELKAEADDASAVRRELEGLLREAAAKIEAREEQNEKREALKEEAALEKEEPPEKEADLEKEELPEEEAALEKEVPSEEEPSYKADIDIDIDADIDDLMDGLSDGERAAPLKDGDAILDVVYDEEDGAINDALGIYDGDVSPGDAAKEKEAHDSAAAGDGLERELYGDAASGLRLEDDSLRGRAGHEEEKKPENHNDEIISLYKKGRSVLEISKMLEIGQGEVKFVIDMYKAG